MFSLLRSLEPSVASYFEAHAAAVSSLGEIPKMTAVTADLDVQKYAKQIRYIVVQEFRDCHATVARQCCSRFATLSQQSLKCAAADLERCISLDQLYRDSTDPLLHSSLDAMCLGLD